MNETSVGKRQALERRNDYHTDITRLSWLINRHFFKRIQESTTFAKGQMLDVGCGNQPYRALFAKYVNNYIGCDLPPATGTKPQVVCVATALPFAASVFDTVLCTQTLEHLTEPHQAVREIGRVLRPGGYAIITAPLSERPHERPYDFFRFTAYGLEYLARSAGLEVVQMHAMGGTFAMLGQQFSNMLIDRLIKPFNLQKISRVIQLPVNLIFGTLETLFPDTENTANYMLIAHKPL